MLRLKDWKATWKALGVKASKEMTMIHASVLMRYAEDHRHYHTLQHLEECAERLAELQDTVSNLAEVQLALWFHDAVYDPRRGDNEIQSADWAREAALKLGVAGASADRIHQLILFTRHNEVPRGLDAEVLIDVDLAILGASPQRFEQYEEQVRQEYAWVPIAEFRHKRAEILRGFLARPALFSTPRFRARYEAHARENLQWSIDRLTH